MFIQKIALTQNNFQISLITCSPGNELYSIFGHTAIRVVDSNQGTDYFFNYGTFDFDDPNFLLKFTRGKLDYYLNIDDGMAFFDAYKREGRTITEQILLLTNQQKAEIYKALIENIDPKNKYYKYDFLFDNCTTRARNLLKKHININTNIQLLNQNTTFRQMLYQYLDSGNMAWSKLGIDILLGSKIDVVVNNEQSTFLPDYFMLCIDSNNKTKKIIEQTKYYNKQLITHPNFSNHIPSIIFAMIALITAFVFYKKQNNMLMAYAKFTLSITGILGVVLLFMWFGTDHKSCANNYNLLWALPTNIFGLLICNKKNSVSKNYFKTITYLTLLLLINWFWLPQQFNIALLFLVFANAICYRYLWLHNSN